MAGVLPQRIRPYLTVCECQIAWQAGVINWCAALLLTALWLLYACAPQRLPTAEHRLDRYNRFTEFFEVGPGAAIDDYPHRGVWGRGQTTIHLRVGMTYIISTPESCLATFRAAEIRGSGGRTVVTVDYVYQSRYGVGYFEMVQRKRLVV